MTLEQVEAQINKAKQEKHTELYLSYCDIAQLPSSLFELSQLSMLILTGNDLESLPVEICRLTQLKVLDISGNKLTFLPEELGSLSNLSRLELAANKITHLPNSIGSLGNLDILDCFGNELKQFPDSIVNCHNLSELKLAENDLNTLPEQFGRLSALKVLDLTDNELKKLPKSFYQLTKLTELYLNGNLLDVPFHILTKHSREPSRLLENIQQHIEQQKEARQKKVEIAQNKIATRDEPDLKHTSILETLNSTFAQKIKATRDTDTLVFTQDMNGQISTVTSFLNRLENKLKLLQALVLTLGKMAIAPGSKQLSELITRKQKFSEGHLEEIYQSLCSVAKELDFGQAFSLQTLTVSERRLTCQIETTELIKHFSLCYEALQECLGNDMKFDSPSLLLLEHFFKHATNENQSILLSEKSLALGFMAIMRKHAAI